MIEMLGVPAIVGVLSPGRISGYSIDTANISADACVDVLQTDWGSAGVFYGITIKGTTEKAFYYSSGTYPVSVTNAVTACKEGNTSIHIHFK